jgi:toxin ParE1/3/4
MAFRVLLTEDAERDLEELYAYIAGNDSAAAAAQVLDRIERAIESLGRFPNRGHYPEELLSLGIREYRETLLKPYRIIYRVIGRAVFVYLIADGRRDMQTLLARRLLGA